MNKISNRLKILTEFIEKNDQVVDVGCDHGYLSIYLKANNLCKKVIASDINKNALSGAIKNVKNSGLDIPVILSDGICDVDLKGINTLIISGMGTSTVLHILEDDKKLKKIAKLIIQSNNDHELLRRSLNKKGYYLENEVIIFDKGKWYVTCLFVKKDVTNSESEIKYGYLSNSEYNKYLVNYHKSIIKKIPLTSIKKRYNKYLEIKKLKKAIKEANVI
ncbi:MAG: SAM-dependent methyltransferase [Bacilli bacterium]|nr:SAM-dependent methyltransferase [Bacilli bacterium]